MPDDMDRRPYDKGFYHMLLDSKEAGEKIAVVGRDMFRPDQRRPHIDEITVDDTALLVRLIQGNVDQKGICTRGAACRLEDATLPYSPPRLL